jgi:hypothetical protein
MFGVVKLGPPGLRVLGYIGCERGLIYKTGLRITMRYYQRLQSEELETRAESCEHDDTGTVGNAEVYVVVRRLCKRSKEQCGYCYVVSSMMLL